tara:strand:- start:95 stop:388 length:294 start_codon:yes stop_codon:yes gene_type:complete
LINFSKIGYISLFIITCFLLIYILAIGINNIFRYNKYQLQYNEIEMKLINEKIKNKELINELKKTKKEEYWELKAKQELGYIKSNEKVFILTKGVTK